jgi:hypothetical protein
MTIRTITLAAFATVALAACTKPADRPVSDSALPTNATPTVMPTDSVAPVDSAKPDSTSPKPMTDSAKPTVDSTRVPK